MDLAIAISNILCVLYTRSETDLLSQYERLRLGKEWAAVAVALCLRLFSKPGRSLPKEKAIFGLNAICCRVELKRRVGALLLCLLVSDSS